MRKDGEWAKCDHCERLVEDPWHWGESLMCDACYGWVTTSGASEDDPFRHQETEHFRKACENRRKRREQRIAKQAVRAFASELCGLDYNVVQERIFAKVMEAMDEDDAARGHAEQGGADDQDEMRALANGPTFHREMRAALRQLLEETEWRDIATAPKDGTPFLAFLPTFYQGKGAVETCCWFDGGWSTTAAPMMVDPTHWMPLPAPPKGGESDV